MRSMANTSLLKRKPWRGNTNFYESNQKQKLTINIHVSQVYVFLFLHFCNLYFFVSSKEDVPNARKCVHQALESIGVDLNNLSYNGKIRWFLESKHPELVEMLEKQMQDAIAKSKSST